MSSINVGTKEEKSVQIYSFRSNLEPGAGLFNRLRPKCPGSSWLQAPQHCSHESYSNFNEVDYLGSNGHPLRYPAGESVEVNVAVGAGEVVAAHHLVKGVSLPPQQGIYSTYLLP